MAMSGYPYYSSKNEDLRKSGVHHVRFFIEMCVFELKTGGHRIIIFKSIMRILRRVKNEARALIQNSWVLPERRNFLRFVMARKKGIFGEKKRVQPVGNGC